MRIIPFGVGSTFKNGHAICTVVFGLFFSGAMVFSSVDPAMANSDTEAEAIVEEAPVADDAPVVEEAPVHLPGEGPERDEEYTFIAAYVQLDPIMVPISKLNKKIISIPVSMFLKVNKVKGMRLICSKKPYVRDAIMQVVSGQPIRTKGRKLFDAEISPALAASINKTFGRKYVKEVAIFSGKVARSNPKVMERLIISNTCKTILRKKNDEESAIWAAENPDAEPPKE